MTDQYPELVAAIRRELPDYYPAEAAQRVAAAAETLWDVLSGPGLGLVDEFGGMECQRVLPAAIAFILDEANSPPDAPPLTATDGRVQVLGCPAGVHVRSPSARITAGICPELTADEINGLLWDTATGAEGSSWGGFGDLHDSLVRKGYYTLDVDPQGMTTATDKGVRASEALFAARRRALSCLACASLATLADRGSPEGRARVGQAVMSDRLNGASWEEIGTALGIAADDAVEIFITYC